MEKIILILNTQDSVKKRLFLQTLRLFNFVQVETDAAFVKRFIKNVPKNVPLNDDDILKELTNLRHLPPLSISPNFNALFFNLIKK